MILLGQESQLASPSAPCMPAVAWGSSHPRPSGHNIRPRANLLCFGRAPLWAQSFWARKSIRPPAPCTAAVAGDWCRQHMGRGRPAGDARRPGGRTGVGQRACRQPGGRLAEMGGRRMADERADGWQVGRRDIAKGGTSRRRMPCGQAGERTGGIRTGVGRRAADRGTPRGREGGQVTDVCLVWGGGRVAGGRAGGRAKNGRTETANGGPQPRDKTEGQNRGTKKTKK